MSSHPITISIGSNTADRYNEVEHAMLWLRRFMPAAIETTPYTTHTEPQSGITDSSSTFLNAVVRGRTPFSREVLQKKIKAYERARGRTSELDAVGEIIIDIDLVEFDSEVVNTKEFNSEHFKIGIQMLK